MALAPGAVRGRTPFDAAGFTAVSPAAPRVMRPDTARVRKPTAANKRTKAAEDSVRRTEKLFGFRVTRPAKAGYLALVPGLGQVYNRRWWKIPLVYGALGTTFLILRYDQQGLKEYSDAKDLLDANRAQLGDPALGPRASKAPSYNTIKINVEYFRHYRDGFIFYTSIAYGLQILDAIVDAHLHEFDVSDNLALHWQPALLFVPGQALPTAPGVALAFRPRGRPQ